MTSHLYQFNYFSAGCYRFSDGSFLKYLTTHKLKLSISAPIFAGNKCNISTKFTYFRDNCTGRSETGNVFSFEHKQNGKRAIIKVYKNGFIVCKNCYNLTFHPV